MSVDKHMLQKWVAGAAVRFRKTRNPFAQVPILNRIPSLAEITWDRTHEEKIDLTRARDFSALETSEDILFASFDLPVFGKCGIGNDIGLAIASFNYKDEEGDEHGIIAICAYVISGTVMKARELKHIIVMPMVRPSPNPAAT